MLSGSHLEADLRERLRHVLVVQTIFSLATELQSVPQAADGHVRPLGDEAALAQAGGGDGAAAPLPQPRDGAQQRGLAAPVVRARCVSQSQSQERNMPAAGTNESC
eukprot:1357375-Pyramimonas_sp.AAC.1